MSAIRVGEPISMRRPSRSTKTTMAAESTRMTFTFSLMSAGRRWATLTAASLQTGFVGIGNHNLDIARLNPRLHNNFVSSYFKKMPSARKTPPHALINFDNCTTWVGDRNPHLLDPRKLCHTEGSSMRIELSKSGSGFYSETLMTCSSLSTWTPSTLKIFDDESGVIKSTTASATDTTMVRPKTVWMMMGGAWQGELCGQFHYYPLVTTRWHLLPSSRYRLP